MKTRIVAAALVWGSAISHNSFANSWEDAEALFSQREDGQARIAEARTKYLELLSASTTPSEKILAVSQLGRLAVYEGEILLPKTDVEGRKKVFSQCFCANPKVSYNPLPQPSCESPGFVDAISPANLGESHPAFHYFRSVCTAYWGEVAGPLEKLAYVAWLKEDFAAGQMLDTRFEGGGIQRVAAGVYVNPKAAAVQLYNPEQALALATKALQSSAYPGDSSSGSEYYENHAIVADSLQQLAADRPNDGFQTTALNHVTQALKEMDERSELDDLPVGRGPEFRHYYKRVKVSYQELTGLEWPQTK